MIKAAKIREGTQLQKHQQDVKKRFDKQDSILLYQGLGPGKTLSSIAASEEKHGADDTFYHKTPNIVPLLESGRIDSLRTLALKRPEKTVSVEPHRWSRDRETHGASKAYDLMKKIKDVDYVFLTKGGPLRGDTYGKYTIEKNIKTPKKTLNLNLIPQEHKQKKFISLKRNTKIYVPDSEVSQFKKDHRGYEFLPSSMLKEKELDPYSFSDLWSKVLLKSGLTKESDISDFNQSNIKKLVSQNAHLTGSAALGIDTEGSDVDVLVTFKNQNSMLRAKNRIQKKFDMRDSPFNKPDRNKIVLTNPQGDIVLSSDPKAYSYLNSLQTAKKALTPERREEIKFMKEQLRNSWFFPETRYTKYKKDLDKELGIQSY